MSVTWSASMATTQREVILVSSRRRLLDIHCFDAMHSTMLMGGGQRDIQYIF
jgi:hypothetical protein